MSFPLVFNDFYAIGSLLILLFGAVALLIMQTFFSKQTSHYSFPLAMTALVIGAFVAYHAPETTNPLLTKWLVFDRLSRFFSLFFIGIGLFSVCLSSSFLERFKASQGEYYFLLLSALFGLLMIGSAADFLTLFLGLETLSIALYILCGYMKKWGVSSEASMKYFFIGAIGAAFLLYGIALLYGAVGTTRFEHLLENYQRLTSTSSKALFFGGISLITAGLCFKAAIVPFHVWAPDVYSGAPTPVTAFMAVGTKVGAFAALARLFLVVLPGFDLTWNEALAWLAYPTLIYANFTALRQTQLRRFFAYSGISHAGFLLFPLIAGTPEALSSLLFYLVIYALGTFAAFAVLALLDQKEEGVTMDDLRGLFKRDPFSAFLMSCALITLAGIPPSIGFFAKFYVFKAVFEAGYYPLVVVGLLTAILSAVYYLKIASMMMEESVSLPLPHRSWPVIFVGVLSVTALIVLSCYPDPLIQLISH